MNRYIQLVLFSVGSITFAMMLVRMSEVGPITTGSYRLLLALPAMLVVSYMNRHTFSQNKFSFRNISLAALTGIFFACDLIFINMALLKTTLAESMMLTNMVPFIVAPLSILVFKEKIPHIFYLTFLGAGIGLYLMMGTGSISQGHLNGDLLALTSAFFYACYFIGIKYLRSELNTNIIMSIACLSGGIFLAIVGFLSGEVIIPVSFHGWFVLVLISILGMVIGQILLTYAIKFVPINLGALLLLTSPIYGAFFAFLFYKETLTLSQIGGILIIMLSVYFGKIILSRPIK